MPRPGTQTLVYAPEVRVHIKTRLGNIDVSRDVVSGSVNRITNGISTAQLMLNNKNAKYTGRLRRMDPIVIFMKRDKWVQVFSGYLDIVPAMDLFPTVCRIRASCTLKRLKYTYWDPGLPASQELMMQQMNSKQPDAGVGDLIVKVLEKAGGWNKDDIHIQQIPKAFMEYAKKYMPKIDEAGTEAAIRALLNVGGVAGGVPAEGEYGGFALSATDPPDAPGLMAFMYAIKMHESGGNYKAANPGSSARGAYQYIRSTWNNYGGYSEAHLAPPAVQDQRAYNDFYAAYKKYHNWDSVTLVHFTGRPNAPLDVVPGPGNPTPRTYIADIHKKMAEYKPPAGQQSAAPASGSNPVSGAINAMTGALDKLTNTAQNIIAANTPVGASTPVATPATKQKLLAPVNGSVVGKFGKHYDPVTKKEIDTLGVDYSAPSGTPVKAAADGVVGSAGSSTDPNLGVTSIEIKHSPTRSTKYGGLKEVKVSPGATVKQGDIIGTTGGAGFDNRVRFQTWVDGKPVDPAGQVGKEWPIDTASMAVGATAPTGTLDPQSQQLQDAVFNVLYNAPRMNNQLALLLTGERALMNDVQLLDTIQGMCKAGLREFMSMPTGEFVAFYPDYFGLNGSQPTMKIQDVEMKDVKIEANDDAFTTHVYATGDTNAAGSVNETDLMNTGGVVSVNMPFVFDQLVQIDPAEKKYYSPTEIYKRFGPRPLRFDFAAIRKHEYEFFQALQLFQRKWAEQSSTNVSLTFMPELLPGCRVELASHNIGVYVNAVTHTFSFTDGFETQAEFMCPTSLNKGVGGVLPAGV